eukprot:3004485-Rhodomonas_salina.1
MPKSFWPDDGGEWTVTVECMTVKDDGGTTSVVCCMLNGPVSKDIGEDTLIPVSNKKRCTNYSIRGALKTNYPNATTPRLILQAQVHYERVFGAVTGSVPTSAPVRDT